MFRIGEFSKIAQTPISQLRYYDQIGLFQPAHTDTFTNYRYYSADQLPALNRILALKELGMTLDQIKRLVQDNVSAEEMHGMLALRKAQIEQALEEEINRLRIVEARLRQVERKGLVSQDDIILKSIPAQPFLSTRNTLPNIFDGVSILEELVQQIPPRVGVKNLSHVAAIVHGDAFRMQQADIEMGYLLHESTALSFLLPSGKEMGLRQLPEEAHVISAVRIGPFENGFDSYAEIGRWVEQNGYAITGPAREVFIELPSHENNFHAVTDIQFPVAPAQRLLTD